MISYIFITFIIYIFILYIFIIYYIFLLYIFLLFILYKKIKIKSYHLVIKSARIKPRFGNEMTFSQVTSRRDTRRGWYTHVMIRALNRFRCCRILGSLNISAKIVGNRGDLHSSRCLTSTSASVRIWLSQILKDTLSHGFLFPYTLLSVTAVAPFMQTYVFCASRYRECQYG